MSVASSTSDDDYLIRRINNLLEPELRGVLQHIALIHPEVVLSALKHVKHQYEDAYSVVTEQMSNTKDERPPPIHPSTNGTAHPSKRGGTDDDDECMRQPLPGRSPHAEEPPQQRPSLPPQVPRRRSVSPTAPQDPPRISDVAPTAFSRSTSSALGVCFLLYDSDSAKLMVHYSRQMTPVPSQALAVWTPRPPYQIQAFKFQEHSGRSELIGNCAAGVSGRKNYYSGWCQFVRLAKGLNAGVTVFPHHGANSVLEVDLFLYFMSECRSVKVKNSFETEKLTAVACLPKHASFYENIAVDINKWMTEAATIGSSTSFDLGPNSPQSPTQRRRLAPPHPPQNSGTSPSISRPKRLSPIPASPSSSPTPENGACYLVYDPDSSGKLVLNYSRSPVQNAIDKWVPGGRHRIQGFKFFQNHGRSELISNCASGVNGRKNYYSGWCQFVRAARAMEGTITLWDPTSTGLFVDVYMYTNDDRAGYQTVQLIPGKAQSVWSVNALAVACVPRHAKFYSTITVDINKWLADASSLGAGSRF